MLEAYNLNKDNLLQDKILETEKYLYSVGVSKKNKIEDISIKKNKLKAEIKLLNRINNKINWPKDFPIYLKQSLWRYYTSKKDFQIQGIKIVDKGEIADNYFVVVGIKKINVDKIKIKYDEIKKELE